MILLYLVAGFSISLVEVSVSGFPGVQSFAWGKSSDGKWLIIGGRRDGLHPPQPFNAFQPTYDNYDLIVVDPVTGQVWTYPVSSLPYPFSEQLRSTNMQFYQVGDRLYITGGYGYSPTEDEHITYPYLTALDVDSVVNAIVNGGDPSRFFRYVFDSLFAVTGGQMGYMDGKFYLAGGQYFYGRYTFSGMGFIQKYTNAVRVFSVTDDGTGLGFTPLGEFYDSIALHRRDYSMVPQIFPEDRSFGYTMFTGVFRYDANLPWLDIVDVRPSGHYPVPGFYQLLSHYHSARLPIYDSTNNEMHTIFFGGIAQFYYDPVGDSLIEDTLVPFVKTVSKVTRRSDGTIYESVLSLEMPGYLGAGAELIPTNEAFWEHEILMLDRLPEGVSLVGYIVGGIESNAPNVFFDDPLTNSWASSRIFKVYVTKGESISVDERLVEHGFITEFKYTLTGKRLILKVGTSGDLRIGAYDVSGKRLLQRYMDVKGRVEMEIDLTEFPAGVYLFDVSTRRDRRTFRIILK